MPKNYSQALQCPRQCRALLNLQVSLCILLKKWYKKSTLKHCFKSIFTVLKLCFAILPISLFAVAAASLHSINISAETYTGHKPL